MDPDGVLWYGCGQRICSQQGTRTQVWGRESGLPAGRWSGLVTDNAGVLWARSDAGLWKKAHAAARFEPSAPQLPKDSKGLRLYAGTDGMLGVPTIAVCCSGMNATGWRSAPIRACPGSRSRPFCSTARARSGWASPVETVLLDREGSLWLGLAGWGLVRRLGFGQWESWTAKEGLGALEVFHITKDAQATMWAATTQGLWRLDRDRKRWRIATAGRLASESLLAVATDRDGTVCAGGTSGDVLCLDHGHGAERIYGALQWSLRSVGRLP